MRRILISCLLLCAPCALLAAQTKVPAWDARGVGPLPRMGITSLDVSDDGKEIVVGTIASFGDPNVIVLDDAGKIVRTYKVGQQWIDNVAFLPGSKDILAICTMPAGRAGDKDEAFLLKGAGVGGQESGVSGQVVPMNLNQEGPWFFHYGDHSNHPTMKLARASRVSGGSTAILAGNQVTIYRKDKQPSTIRLPVSNPDACVSLAVDETGWAVVGATSGDRKGAANLFLIDPDQKKPVWSRPVNKEVDKAPALEKGQYGTPTLPDGRRAELPQRDEKVWAPLSVAIHNSEGKRQIAVADYQGWQRWVRSSATMVDDNQGLRFVSTKPTITIYNEAGKVARSVPIHRFPRPIWSEMTFSADGKTLYTWAHHWSSRGLGGQAILPTEQQLVLQHHLDHLDIEDLDRDRPRAETAHSDVAIGPNGQAAIGSWSGWLARKVDRQGT